MLSYLLSRAHQTHHRINVYHGLVISYLYLALYHIMPLSYPDHQTDPRFMPQNQNIKCYRLKAS